MTGEHESGISVAPILGPRSITELDVKLEIISSDEECEGTNSLSEDVDLAQSTVIRNEPVVQIRGEAEMPEAAIRTSRSHADVMDDMDQVSETLSDSKRPRKSVNLEAKLEIIKRHEDGEGANSIARAVGLAQSTVSTIIKNSCTIKTAGEFMMPRASNRIHKSRDIVMTRMERILRVWIEDNTLRSVPLSTGIIMRKARSLWEATRKNMDPEALKGTADTFKASSGWFERFKRRANLGHMTFHGKTPPSAEPMAVKDFPATLREIVAKEGYTPRQVLNIDETGLCWKNLPTRTCCNRDGSAPGFKVTDDRLTLMLGSNAEGDFKLKPLLVSEWENPQAMSGVDKENLPVIWQSSPNAWVTTSVCRSYIVDYLSKACEEYSKANNLPNKFLLLVDKSPAHPADMGNLASNIKVMFLPPSVKQPMAQDVISTFTAYYVRHTMEQLIQETDGVNKPTIEEFWKSYSIKKAVDNIVASWAEVKESTLNEAWKAIWPTCVYEFLGFRDEDCVKRHTLDLSQESGFSETDEEEEDDLDSMAEPSKEDLVSSSKENTGEKEDASVHSRSLVAQLRQFRFVRESRGQEGQDPSVPLKSLTLTQLRLFRDAISKALAIVVGNDEDSARSSAVSSKVDEAIKCYHELYEKKIDKVKQAIIGSSSQAMPVVNVPHSSSSEVNPTPQSSDSRPSPPRSTADQHAPQQKLRPIRSRKSTAAANAGCGSTVENVDNTNTLQRSGRPVRKRKGTFITGPDFINSDEDGDIDTEVRRCLCCTSNSKSNKPQDMEAGKNDTAVHTESFKKARVNKNAPGKINCFVQTEEQTCRTPGSEVNSHSMNSHTISNQYTRPMVYVDRAEVNSYIKIHQNARPLVFVNRAEVNIHGNNQQYVRPVVFVDRAEVNACSNTRQYDRPMVCVDRAEVRKLCSAMNLEKPSRVEVKKQDEKGKEKNNSVVVKEEWELLELDRVKQEPDTSTTEKSENRNICNVQVKQEPDENMTLVKEEYEMDSPDFVQLN